MPVIPSWHFVPFVVSVLAGYCPIVSTTRNRARPLGHVVVGFGRTPLNALNSNVSWESRGWPEAHP